MSAGARAAGLGQVGEFSIVLVSSGASAGVLDESWFVSTLGAVVTQRSLGRPSWPEPWGVARR